MTVTDKAWQSYIKKLSAINRKAAKIMQDWISVNGLDYPEELISYAYGIVGKYGEAAGALACEMYDTLARAQGKILPDAVPAEPATYSEVARAVIGTKKERPGQVPDTVARLVKQTAADTTLQNAKRDGAQFAWIPHGDTCSFCITLASRGWQYMSKNALKNGHAEHIHANCDCEYGVRFDGKSNVAGYDPDKYLEQYNNAEGTKPQDKINSMRREQYKVNGDKIREQKRDLYARNRSLHYGKQQSFEYDKGTITARRVDRFGYNNIYVDENCNLTERQLRHINQQVTDVKQLLNISETCDANVLIMETGNRLASYNPTTNTLRISSKMCSDEGAVRLQQGFACPDNPLSTIVHEMIHWKDADEYRKTIGPIIDASEKSDYSIFQRESTRKKLIESGVDVNDISIIKGISFYAKKMALDNNWEEVYTEFRTEKLLRG